MWGQQLESLTRSDLLDAASSSDPMDFVSCLLTLVWLRVSACPELVMAPGGSRAPAPGLIAPVPNGRCPQATGAVGTLRRAERDGQAVFSGKELQQRGHLSPSVHTAEEAP